jgi:hypothetical protein
MCKAGVCPTNAIVHPDLESGIPIAQLGLKYANLACSHKTQSDAV